MTATTLVHNRVDLALHTLRPGAAGHPALLVLHGLGERTTSHVPEWADGWPGAVVGLDFTGHGASTVPTGGGYSAEILLADADAALSHLGEATVVGRGLGAYVALLLAGARSDRVRGTVLADGPGLSGGPSSATSAPVLLLETARTPPDPYALVELARDLRPPDYAATFARLAVEGSDLVEPVSIAAAFRPEWLEAVAGVPGVASTGSIASALAAYTAGD